MLTNDWEKELTICNFHWKDGHMIKPDGDHFWIFNQNENVQSISYGTEDRVL